MRGRMAPVQHDARAPRSSAGARSAYSSRLLPDGRAPMDLQLARKIALISGSTAGIGFAAAMRFAREGAAVVVNGRTQARVDDAVDRIRQETANPHVSGVAADLGNAAGIESLVKAVPTVDVLVNNLGIFEPKPFESITDADWFRFFEVNVMAGVRLARAYLPGMRQKNWGRILFVSSESAVNIPVEMIHYGMTKTAEVAVARGLAEAVAGTAITVNSILAGPTASEGVGTFVAQLARERGIDARAMEKEFFASARPSSLLKRFITPDEVANLIAYTASPLAAA